MKVAFASRTGERVDEHFGTAAAFHIWEIGPDEAHPAGTVVPVTGPDGDEEDRIESRTSALAGCAIVCTVAIGGPPAAKLVARRIHPMKTGTEVAIADLVEKLQEVLRGTPPPWLRKALHGGNPTLPGGGEND
jgi:nitrogen fixation protein NifX